MLSKDEKLNHDNYAIIQLLQGTIIEMVNGGCLKYLQFLESADFCLCMILPFSVIPWFQF